MTILVIKTGSYIKQDLSLLAFLEASTYFNFI